MPISPTERSGERATIGEGAAAGKVLYRTYAMLIKSGMGAAAGELLTALAGKVGLDASQLVRLNTATAKLEAITARLETRGGRSAGAGTFAQLATKTDEAVFWSGRTRGVGGETVAKSIAKGASGTTLEMLLERNGTVLPDFSTAAGKAAWEGASREMAKQASGKVRVVLGDSVRADSIWNKVELPQLMRNPRVTEIIAVDPKTRATKIIFKR